MNYTREHLENLVKTSVVEVTFTKKNGDVRVMLCTLHPNYLPPIVESKEKKEHKVNPEVLAVYDLNANGWRSFRIDSVTAISLVTMED